MMMESTSREAAKFLIHAEESLNQNELASEWGGDFPEPIFASCTVRLTNEWGKRIPTRNSFAPICLPIRFWESFGLAAVSF